MFLKLQKDFSVLKPNIVIFSVMANTLKRTIFTHRFSSFTCAPEDRPFYLKKESELLLKKPSFYKSDTRGALNSFRHFLGHSFVIDTILNSWFHGWWNCSLLSSDYPNELTTRQDPQEISCLILKNALHFTNQNDAQLVVVGQAYWNPNSRKHNTDQDLRTFLKCASDLGIPNLNIDESLEKIFYQDFNRYQSLFIRGGHMTNQGNLYVSQQVERLLEDGKSK